MKPPAACEILIVGGGPAGLALLLQLRAGGRDAWLVEARTVPSRKDPRALALSEGSRQLLNSLSVWPEREATPIHTVYVSQSGSFGRIKLTREELSLPALGYVLSMGDLLPRMWTLASEEGLLPGWRAERLSTTASYAAVELSGMDGETALCTCRLLILADGGKSLADLTGSESMVKDYGQVAILARVRASHAQANTAFERFADDGPIAVLPQDEGYAVVWTQTGAAVEQRLEEPPEAFCAALSERLGGRLGMLTLDGMRHMYPLRLSLHARRPVPRVVTIGNAAQALHPIAGQGLNLGLRDGQVLAGHLERARDVGEAPVLAGYQSARRLDQAQAVGFTDALVESFRLPGPLLKHARSLGLTALEAAPVGRRAVLRNLVFGWRG